MNKNIFSVILLQVKLYNIYLEEDVYSSKMQEYTTKVYNFMMNEELKKYKSEIEKLKIESVSSCYAYSKENNDFGCSVEYKIYLKNYGTPSFNYESELWTYLNSGSQQPQTSNQYLKKWTFVGFDKNSMPIDTYTGK